MTPRRDWTRPDLPRYTWDQAHILGLATARGFQALGLKPGTIRQWASRGHLTPAGKAPGGALLYPIRSVSEVAARLTDPHC